MSAALSADRGEPQRFAGRSGSRVLITLFKDYAARTKEEKTLDLRELAELIERTSAPEKEHLPWLKSARFGNIAKGPSGSLRHNANVREVWGAVGDYDGETMSPEEAAERLDKAGIIGLIYTSPSHSDSAPRWRVFCPFRAGLAPDKHYPMMARVNGVLGGVLASESFVLSQSYYFGAVNRSIMHQAIVVAGCRRSMRRMNSTKLQSANQTAIAVGNRRRQTPRRRSLTFGRRSN